MDDATIKKLYEAYFTSKMTPSEEVDYENDVNAGLVGLPKAGQLKAQLTPFDQNKHATTAGQPRENVTTEISPDGKAWNIPLIWYDQSGKPSTLKADTAVRQAQKYELTSNLAFPRFGTVSAGTTAATQRNNITDSLQPLATPTKQQILNPGGFTKQDVINPGGFTKKDIVNPAGITKETALNPAGITKENIVNPAGLTKKDVVNPGGITKETIVNPGGLTKSNVLNPLGLKKSKWGF